MDKKLEVKNLQISFRTQGGILKAVRNISFDLYKGETLAIVGESGSGKSVTSKAIMGILAGNSIVEGGEIIYDGKDLLKIDEEDFHKIRGDKIAMIFQDPLSSLNPIMRVGDQLTEAMILKAKSGKKNAREAFNTLLKKLETNIIEADNNTNVEDTTAKIKTFDTFCIQNTAIEEVYNEAYSQALELDMATDTLLVYMQHNKKVDLLNDLKEISRLMQTSVHPYVVVEDAAWVEVCDRVNSLISQKVKTYDVETISLIMKINDLVNVAINKEKPNFFTLAYYKMCNPEVNTDVMDIKEMNEMTRKYLDEKFMLDFIDTAKRGVNYSHKKSIENKKEALPVLDEAIAYFAQDEYQKKAASEVCKKSF